MPIDPNTAASPESGIFGLEDTPEQARVVLVPAPFEATTSGRRGTADGPAAIVDASRQVDLRDIGMGDPWRPGIAMLDADPRIREASDRAVRIAERRSEAAMSAEELGVVDELCAQTNGWIGAAIGEWLERGKLVGLLGGD
ncbi:hypothetical protein CKO31_25310, partial [Thiohalocapsa halophila]